MAKQSINVRGPSKIALEGFMCEICGKQRSRGHLQNQHVVCSKIKQAAYAKLRGEK